ncbi:protein phosphatase CheZ [Sediminicurvatus halobius]
MAEETTLSMDEYLAHARELVRQIEAGEEDAARVTVEALARLRERELFRELGTLTRELHEALKSFKVDTRLGDIAANDIPDARERLNHVIELTEQAAHRTLTAIESGLPLAEGLAGEAGKLAERWQRFRQRELSAAEFRELSRDIEAYLQRCGGEAATLQAHLSDALMAQDYQDITGQIIRRVIGLVQEVEDGLVELVRISGHRIAEETPAAADKADDQEADRRGRGPAIPGQEGDVVSGQDEVDDLLSSLGF